LKHEVVAKHPLKHYSADDFSLQTNDL